MQYKWMFKIKVFLELESKNRVFLLLNLMFKKLVQ